MSNEELATAREESPAAVGRTGRTPAHDDREYIALLGTEGLTRTLWAKAAETTLRATVPTANRRIKKIIAEIDPALVVNDAEGRYSKAPSANFIHREA